MQLGSDTKATSNAEFSLDKVSSQFVKGSRCDHLTKFCPTSQTRNAVALLRTQLQYDFRSDAQRICSYASVNSAKQ